MASAPVLFVLAAAPLGVMTCVIVSLLAPRRGRSLRIPVVGRAVADLPEPTQVPAATPESGPPAPAAPVVVPTPAPPVAVVPAPAAPHAPAPEPVPAQGTASYANCTEVKAAGAAPIHPGDPGSESEFDRDDDGAGCES